MAFLPRILRREPESLKGIRERSAVVRSAELSMPPFRKGVTGEEARAALAALPRPPCGGRERLN